MKIIRDIVLVVVLLALLFLTYMFAKTFRSSRVAAPNSKSASSTPISNGETATWQTYQNVKYNFVIQYPLGWRVVDNSEAVDPSVIFAKNKADDETEGPTVIVMPKGEPKDGKIGKMQPTSVPFNETLDQGSDFVLESGDVWSTYASFRTVPKSWEEWGFVWASVPIANKDMYCIDNGKRISIDSCDISGENAVDLRMTGSVNKDDRATEERMLQSFRFIK